MTKILVIAPRSPHAAKFLDMISSKVDCDVVLQETNLAVEIKQLYAVYSQKSMKGLLSLLKKIWFGKHDFIHVHTLNFSALIVAIFSLKPIILTAWGSDVLLVPQRSLIHKLIAKFVLWRAKIVTANDALNMLRAIKKLSPRTKVVPIHFGVSKYCRVPDTDEKQNIIYSPRGHSDLYNIDKIIEAFRPFSKANPKWQLVISGMEDSVNTPKLKEQAKGLNVLFTGWLSQAANAEWMAKAKIMVSIPSSDALSVTVMEAIYSNCICFVSDLSPNREVVSSGVNGFYGLDFGRYKKIDLNKMVARNKKLSKNWTFDANKRKFLSLYNQHD